MKGLTGVVISFFILFALGGESGRADLSFTAEEKSIEKKIESCIVNGNDNLWIISKRVYGVGHKWNLIYQANMNRIKNPNVLIPGTELIIPDVNTKLKKNIEVAPPGYKYVKTVRAHLTGYCPCSKCCGRHANGRTSINKNAWVMNGCAVDKRAIPYGWMVYIPGKGFRESDDTGSAMRRSWRRGIYHIDVRFRYHHEARRFNKWMNVKIYQPID